MLRQGAVIVTTGGGPWVTQYEPDATRLGALPVNTGTTKFRADGIIVEPKEPMGDPWVSNDISYTIKLVLVHICTTMNAW